MAEQKPADRKEPAADKDKTAAAQEPAADDGRRSCQHTQKELDEAREEYRRTHPAAGGPASAP